MTFPAPFAGLYAIDLVAEIDLSPLQEQILKLLSPKKTQMRQILAKTGAAERTALRAIDGLVKAGLVEVDGAGRARGYRKSGG